MVPKARGCYERCECFAQAFCFLGAEAEIQMVRAHCESWQDHTDTVAAPFPAEKAGESLLSRQLLPCECGQK